MTHQLFEALLEKAKADKKTLIAFKNAAVRGQQFELACHLRELETSLFPESAEVKAAKEEAKKLNLVFRMVGLTVSDDVCWLIGETLKLHRRKKGGFSIKDASILMAKCKELFETE